MNTRHLLAIAAALLAVRCDTAPSASRPPPALAPPAGAVASEPELNGTVVSLGAPIQSSQCAQPLLRKGGPLPLGCGMNGPLLSSSLAWVSLSPVTLAGGQALDAPAVLAGTSFSGTAVGAPVHGADFVGARFEGVLASGSPVAIRIDSATPGSGAQADVWRYGFSYQGSAGDWQALCSSGAGAVPVLGRWDYSQGTATGGSKTNDPAVFTIGCEGSAIEKCVNLGYKPWASTSGVPLDPHHQACVRLIRADYCGDGYSQTTEGRVINLYDGIGIQDDTETWLMEAEWTPAGARCVNLLNRSLLGVLCAPLLGMVSCGATSHFGTGTLLMSETPLGPVDLP